MSLALVDTHAHVDFDRFDADRDAVFERARAAGLVQIVNVGVGPEGSRRSVELAAKRPGVFATAGIHPHDAGSLDDAGRAAIEGFVRSGKCVGVGECGLDYFRNLSSKEDQEQVFRWQVGLARECDLPLVVHCRDAYPDLFRILEDEAARGGVRGVMHCFSGGVEEARRSLALGFFVSFSGVITYPNAPKTREAAKAVPLDRTLVETDCPFLAPQPQRGKRNEPSFVVHAAEELARAHGVRLEDVGEATTQAARAVFRLPGATLA
jgi:TatD DNase family protein